MPRNLKALDHMNADSLRYLAENTDITYLSEGSIARALVESSNLEIARVQEFIASSYSNVFINSASGTYLDLIGEMLGVTRLDVQAGQTSAEDNNIQLSVVTGTLGSKFPHPTDSNKGLIPAGLLVMTADQSIVYRTVSPLSFPVGAIEIYISVVADTPGTASNVGKNRLVSHGGPSGVNVTNLSSIANGGEVESDQNYRFRLANALAASATANEAAVRLAVAGIPDVSRIVFTEFARGAGTFDAMLVPVKNRVSAKLSQIAQKSIESVAAFGISARVTEPDYVPFRVAIQLIPQDPTRAGTLDVGKVAAKTAVLDYFESIPLGGELIINRLRAVVISSVVPTIKDIRIIDLCIDGRPRAIRNIRLVRNQLFTPDLFSGTEAVLII